MKRRRWLQTPAGLLLAMLPLRAAWGATVVGVRVWPAAEYTRVTIESDARLSAQHQVVDNPHRLVIDLEGMELSPALRELAGRVQADDPYIAGLRIGQYQPRVVRLVFDLRQPTIPEVFTLEPVAAFRHRLVFDLRPTQAPDPLLALVRDKLQAEERARQSVQDALGDFIGRAGLDKHKPAPGKPSATLPPPSTPAPPAELTPEQLQRMDRLVIVALDPGHGGEDPGAIGPSGLKEKDVVLAVALLLRDRVNALPGFRAFLTRDADYFVPLGERVRKARRVQADLFVSIHADAFFTPTARGASVYALSGTGATSAAARWMAERENAADSVGGVQASSGDAQLLRALADMSTTAQIRDSLQLADLVLPQLDRIGRLHKRRPEQAGFAVLKAPDIPSILVETAFISNPEEEARLADAEYQRQLADALAAGIRHYFARNPSLARRRAT